MGMSHVAQTQVRKPIAVRLVAEQWAPVTHNAISPPLCCGKKSRKKNAIRALRDLNTWAADIYGLGVNALTRWATRTRFTGNSYVFELCFVSFFCLWKWLFSLKKDNTSYMGIEPLTTQLSRMQAWTPSSGGLLAHVPHGISNYLKQF